jgi:hypothetical protein
VSSVRAYRAHLQAAAAIRKANIDDSIESLVIDDSQPTQRPPREIPRVEHRYGPKPLPGNPPERRRNQEPCGLAMALLIAAGGGGLTLCLAATAIYGLQLALEQLARALGV